MKIIFPTFFTILNLLSGFLGVLFLINKNYNLIEYCIYLSLIFDFLDGFIARKLNATSSFGKQLDSFADLISFGLLPSLILYDWFLTNSSTDIYKYFSVFILLFSSIRLSKFNLDNKQEFIFLGIPTPLVALFFNSLIFNSGIYNNFLTSEILLLLVMFFSIMMVVNIKFISLKFKNFSIFNNIYRYALLLISLFLILFIKLDAFPIIVIIYILISLFYFLFVKKEMN
tara:strand:- start:544 stop:1227 length:684 start_codon:yes stop_codon:yes gene_type:complete